MKQFSLKSVLRTALIAAVCTPGFAAAGRAQTAAFVGIDTTTQGTWTGRYGHDGYTVEGGGTQTPSYSAAVSTDGASPYTWETLTASAVNDLRTVAAQDALKPDVDGNNTSGNNAVGAAFNVFYALSDLYQSPGTQDRVAAMVYNTAGTPGTSFTIDVPLQDARPHQVALYFLDHDTQSRAETIQVENAATGAVLDTRRMSYFVFGQYLIWNVTGHVKFVVTQNSGRNAVVGGIFFDPPAARPALALGEINAAQFGAVGNGITDNTAAFQKALDAAGRIGAVVRVPAGRYSFRGNLNVPAQVVLEGVNAGERYSSGDYAKAGRGTVLLVRGGANGSVPFLTLHDNSALRGVTLLYPNQPRSAAPGWTAPTPYPPTISLSGNNATVDYVCGVNPYTFIVKSLDGTSVRTNVRHVSGQPLFRGLIADADPDVTHYEDIHFGLSWDSSPAMAQWMLTNAWGISVYRGDDLKFTDCSADGYSRGFYFGFSHLPTTVDLSRGRSGPYSGGLQGCTAENCRYGVWLDATRQDADITFHGCAFSSNPNTNGAAVMISNNVDTNGYMTFDGCRFWQSRGPLFINQARAGASVTIAGCSFDTWGTGSSGLDPSSPAIFCGDLTNPSAASGKTLIVNCTFNVDQYTYAYTPGEAGVLFQGNTTVSGPHVQVLR